MEKHIPVLLQESLSLLSVQKGKTYIDCTFGSGGHSTQILKKLAGTGRLISFDCDPSTSQWAKEISGDNFLFINDNFANFPFHLDNLGIEKVDGFLFDLGLSSMQLSSERGFSYRQQSSLDMRMNIADSTTAADILNSYSLTKMSDTFYRLGQERKAYKIARTLFNYRKKKRIENVQELVKITTAIIGKRKGKSHPSKKIFQALRIEVNKELDNLEKALNSSLNYLREGAKIVVISYHSLEDKIAKEIFYCSSRKDFSLVCKKPLLPTCKEIAENNRSRSAKLRVLVRDSMKSANHQS